MRGGRGRESRGWVTEGGWEVHQRVLMGMSDDPRFLPPPGLELEPPCAGLY